MVSHSLCYGSVLRVLQTSTRVQIDFSGNYGITDVGLVALAPCCVGLLSLDISGLPCVTDLAVMKLVGRACFLLYSSMSAPQEHRVSFSTRKVVLGWRKDGRVGEVLVKKSQSKNETQAGACAT